MRIHLKVWLKNIITTGSLQELNCPWVTRHFSFINFVNTSSFLSRLAFDDEPMSTWSHYLIFLGTNQNLPVCGDVRFNKRSKQFDKGCTEWPPYTLHVPQVELRDRDWLTDTAHNDINSLHLMQSMQPNIFHEENVLQLRTLLKREATSRQERSWKVTE